MKKLILSVLLVTAFALVNAQNIRFGVQAGVTFASAKAKILGLNITSDSKVGFTAGVLADIPIADQFVFQPSLNFTQKGSKLSETDGADKIESKQTLNYIELPLNFLFQTEAGSGKFFAGIGPALGYGISGKAKDKETINGTTTETTEDIKFGTDKQNDHYKPFEFSGNILAGYELSNGAFIAVNYNLGLNNIDVEGSSDYTYKNRYFGIRIGYKFGGSATSKK
ncbi:MAG: porin family protein [Sphingobacteriales bacterium]